MLSQVQKLQLKNKVEFILHTPGNYRGGILEMTIVIDCSLPQQTAKELSQDIIAALKAHSAVFRNVRLNMVQWALQDSITSQVTAMPVVQMGSYFDSYIAQPQEKTIDSLLLYLKKFHARSKLILLLTQDDIYVEDQRTAMSALQPFLKQKLLIIGPERIVSGRESI